MISKLLFEDEIVLYWDKDNGQAKELYRVAMDGKEVAVTKKTHFTFHNVNPVTSYSVRVDVMDESGNAIKTLLNETLTTPKARKRIDVTKAPYFACGDGKTLNTERLQRAIDDCKAGETVYFPQGVYLSGALRLHSDMEIYVEKDGVLQGSEKVEDYLPKIKSRFEGLTRECYSALLNMGELDENNYGFTCENVMIRGGGKILGGGRPLLDNVVQTEKELLKTYMQENAALVAECDNENVIPARARGRLINISNSRNVVIGDLTLGYGAAWNVHFVYSKDIVTYNCTIRSKGVWNGDGWNPDSSENCTAFNIDFDTHDDAIAIKSGRNPEGNLVKRPTKNVRVFDCRGTRGLSIGSELSGGIEDISVWDCVFDRAGGLNVKTSWKRGGYVKNLKISNCTMGSVIITSKYGCNNDGEPAGELTKIENVTIENVECMGIQSEYYADVRYDIPCLTLIGFEDEENYFENIRLKNVYVHSKQSKGIPTIEVENVKNASIENLYYVKGDGVKNL